MSTQKKNAADNKKQPDDSEVEHQIRMAKKIMNKRHKVLRELAK